MARINIEDQFWLDVGQVTAAVGDYAKAVGMSLLFIRYAQEQHKKGKLISEQDFALRFHESLIGVFAERTAQGIKAVGADQHFGWLDQKVEAGRKGGRSRPEAKSKHLKQNRSKTEANQAKPSDTEASISSSISSSSSSNHSSLNTLPFLTEPAETPVKVYCDCYKEKYGHSPVIGGKQAGILTTFAKNHPGKWPGLIAGYLEMPDSWAVARSHPVELLETKVNEIQRFLKTGKVVTRKVVEHAEELIDKAQGTNRKPRRDLDEILAENAEQRQLGGKT